MVVPLRLISMFLPALIFTVFDALTSAAFVSLPSVILPPEPGTADEFKCHETLLTISVTVLTLVRREPKFPPVAASPFSLKVAEPASVVEIEPVCASTL